MPPLPINGLRGEARGAETVEARETDSYLVYVFCNLSRLFLVPCMDLPIWKPH